MHRLQRAAYRAEADLIGDDRIPPLHESLAALRVAPLRWLGAYADDELVGAVAWSEASSGLDIDRLIVDPRRHRRGAGRALVQAVLDTAGNRPVTVSTARKNSGARALYSSLGFTEVEHDEVIPGLWVTRFLHLGPWGASPPPP